MNPFKRTGRRSRNVPLCAEPLEPRSLLTGGAGDTFAIIPGTISQAGGSTSVSFTIDPAHIHLPKGKLALGIDIVPSSGSSIKPFIESVNEPNGTLIPQTFHSIYDPHLLHQQVASGQGTSAVLTPVTYFPHQPNKPATYTVTVQAEDKTSGDFLLGFYLPGDANGDGKVDSSDLAIVKSELGANANSSKYTFDADANRDGRIGLVDLAYTLQNQGVSLDITPVVQANLVPSSVTSPSTASTTTPSAQYTGTASPDATIIYTNTSAPNSTPVTTTATSTGTYSITVPLVPGQNVFEVQSTDSFGQTITGTINPITYTPIG